MGKAVVFLLVALAAIAAAKPYVAYRNPSGQHQYTLYPLYGNYLYGQDRIPDEYLDRIIGDRAKDVDAAELPPFLHIPDALPSDELSNVDELLELIDPQEQPLGGKPLPSDQKQPDAPVDEKKPNDTLGEPEKQEKPDQKPDLEKENPQEEKKEKPKGNEKEDKDGKGPNPGHSLIPHHHNKGKRPEVEKPNKSKDGPHRGHPAARQEPGKNGQQRDGRGKNPPSPSPPRHPESPVVQINVNVAAPAL
uniref:Uncharacterized protein n=1 Tax=Anopheles culicifacies TaxID=139723 RepID=A0A182MQD6_9DIPT